MGMIIFNLLALIIDIFATFANYSNGNYLWAVILGVCSGVVFSNLIWFIKIKIEG